MYSKEQILNNKYQIEGVRYDDEFYWINYFDDTENIFYAFKLDDDYKIDREFTVDDLANKNDVIIYEYREVEQDV